MSKSGSVYELVLSLTKTEKRYYKLFARLNKQDSNLLSLFDAISLKGLITDIELKEHFVSKTFLQHLDVYKVHLKESILHSMRSFHQSRNMNNILHNHLADANFLFAKGLYKQCYKLILRSKVLAQDSGNYSALLEFIKLESDLLKVNENFQDQNKKLLLLSDEENAVVDNLLIESKSGYKITRAELLVKKFEKSGEDLDYVALINLFAEIEISEKYLTPLLRRKLFLIKAKFHKILFQYKKAQQYFFKYLTALENSTILLRENTEQYIKVMQEHISLSIRMTQFHVAFRKNEELKKLPEMLNKIQKRNNHLLCKVEGYYHQNKISIYLHCGEMEKALNSIKEAELYLTQKNAIINTETKAELITLQCYYYFMINDHIKSKDHFFIHKNLLTPMINSDSAINIYLLNYLLEYVKGNRHSRRSALRLLYRGLLKGKSLSQFENICIGILRKSAITGKKSKSKIVWERILLKELHQLRSGPLWESRYIRFDLISWLESRQQKKPFFQILQEKYSSTLS